jgi:O-antigen ligase
MPYLANKLSLALLCIALFAIHCLIGGGRPVFSLPTFALIGTAAFATFWKRRPDSTAATRFCLLTTAVLFSYLIPRAAIAPVPYLARADIFLMLGCVVTYLLTVCIFTEMRQRFIVVGVLLAVGLLHSGVAVAQALGGDEFMLFGFVRAEMGHRASGMLISPNHLAGYLQMAGALGLSATWWAARKTGWRIFLGYATAACYIALLLTQSRGGVLAAGFSLLVWGALAIHVSYVKNPRSLDRALLFGLLGAVLLAAAGAWFVSNHMELRERLATEFTRDIRVANWKAAIAQFQTAPIFGTGAGTHLYLGRLFRQPELQLDPVHAHGDYLELLAEYGVIGALGMAVFLAAHAMAGIRALRRAAAEARTNAALDHKAIALLTGSLAAFAGLAAHSIVDFNLHIPANALTMAFLFGILAQPASPAEESHDSNTRHAPSMARRVLPFLGAALCAISLVAWPGEFLCERARRQVVEEDYPLAAALAEQSIRLDPWNPFTYFHRGEAFRFQAELEEKYADRQAHRQEADRAYQQALRIFPQDENILVRRGQVLDRLRRFDEAAASYRAAMAADPHLEVLKAFYEEHRKLRAAGEQESEQ